MRSKPDSAKPNLITLEDRLAPAWTVSISGTTVTLTDNASASSATISVNGAGLLSHNLPLGGGIDSSTDFAIAPGVQSIVASTVTAMTVNAGPGADTFVNNTAIGADIDMGDGDDVVYGGSGNDTIRGQQGADFLAGRAGNDLIEGGTENDVLVGGTGNDTAFGEGGNDQLDPLADDQEGDFNDNDDGDDFLNGGDDNDVVRGGDGVNNLFGGPGTDTFQQSVNGTLVLTDTSFTINSQTVSNGHEFETGTVEGQSGNDSINGTGFTRPIVVYGNGGADTIITGIGADFVFGGPGNDSLDSGAGNDYTVGGTGDDTVRGGDDNDQVDTSNVDDGEGSSLNNSDGNDLVDGGAGDDVVVGGYVGLPGLDTIIGGTGIDSFSARFSGTLVMTATSWTLNGVERTNNHGLESGTIYGSDVADSFDARTFGGTLTVYGNGGNDTLRGGTGIDYLFGMAGNDSIEGGVGTDTLIGGTGNDTVRGGDDNDYLDQTNFDDAEGPASNNADGNDLLDGGNGADDLTGDSFSGSPAGLDSLIGGEGVDYFFDRLPLGKVVITDLTTTINGKRVAANQSLETGTFYLSNQADFFDASKYTRGNLYVYGFDGDDTIRTGSGDDIVAGLIGNDSLDGGAGADTVVGGTENDTVRGGLGGDLLDYLPFDDGDSNGANNADGDDLLDGGAGNDNLTAGNGNDTLQGGDGTEYLDGGIGNDVISGGGGNDTIIGGPGNDRLSGDAGNDQVSGDADNDTVSGGDGNDSLLGGTGNDSVSGDNGDDTVRGGADQDTVGGGAGTDVIEGDDSSVAEQYVFANFDMYSDSFVLSKPAPDGNSRVREISISNKPVSHTLAGLSTAVDVIGDTFATTRIAVQPGNKFSVKLNDPSVPNGKLVSVVVPFDGKWSDNDPMPVGQDFWPILFARARLSRYSFAAAGGAAYNWAKPYESFDWSAVNSASGGKLLNAGAAQEDLLAHQTINKESKNIGDVDLTFAYLDTKSAQQFRMVAFAAPGDGPNANSIELGKAYAILGVDTQSGTDVFLYNTRGQDQPNGTPIGDSFNDGVIKLTWAQFIDPANFSSVTVWK